MGPAKSLVSELKSKRRNKQMGPNVYIYAGDSQQGWPQTSNQNMHLVCVSRGQHRDSERFSWRFDLGKDRAIEVYSPVRLAIICFSFFSLCLPL